MTILRKLETWRLRQHFKHVEMVLAEKDVSHLSLNQRQNREQKLKQLHDYAKRGIFPENRELAYYAPCFIDPEGRECAVAHLMMNSDLDDVMDKITESSNYAYIHEMNFVELDDWATQAGFDKEELGLIQPGYWLTFDGTFLVFSLLSWGVGLIMAMVNIRYILKKRYGMIASSIGVLVMIILLMLSLYCFHEGSYAYYLGTHPDGPPYDKPLRDVAPLILGGTVTLIIGVITGGVSLYRIQKYRLIKRNTLPLGIEQTI